MQILLTFGMVTASTIVFYVSLHNISGVKFTLRPLLFAMTISQFVIFLPIIFLPEVEGASNIIVIAVMAVLVYSRIKLRYLSLVYAMLAVIVTILAGTVASTAVLLIFGAFVEDLRNDSILFITNMLAAFIGVFIISKLTGKYLNAKIQVFPDSLKNQFGKYMVFGLAVTLVLFYTNVFLNRFIEERLIIETINTVLLIVYFFFVVSTIYAFVSIIQTRLEAAHKQEMLNSLENYARNIENLYTETRKIRHDYINMIAPLYEYIELADMDKVRSYFQDNILPLNKIVQKSDISLDRLKNIGISELKSIMAMKLLYAQQLKISVAVDIAEPIGEINMDLLDLCRIAGILADNAIEECVANLPAAFRFALIQNGSVVYMVFANTVADTPEINRMFDVSYSTKGKNRGIGLYTLSQILGKYDNAAIVTKLENNELIQEITIVNGG